MKKNEIAINILKELKADYNKYIINLRKEKDISFIYHIQRLQLCIDDVNFKIQKLSQ